ncbi:MAG: LamG-like jellyroll fold domain-containing protein [Christensenellales bacterium]
MTQQGGGVSPSSKAVKLGDNYGDLPTPTREGFAFGDWIDYGLLSEENNLIEPTTFIGQSIISNTHFTGNNFIPLGDGYKFEDKITIMVRASMDDWSLFSSRNMTLFSCAQTGGWNLFSQDGYLCSDIYDKGWGYKTIISTPSLADLSSGYHVFTETFDGEYARLYIDGVLAGTSGRFSSGKIGYNTTNGLFVGAEAGDDTTTPENWTNYFQGDIDYFSVENKNTTETTILTSNLVGVPYLPLGRVKMFEDTLTVTVKASMLNWADFATRQMTLISCAQTGGWNLFSKDGCLYSDIYDKGIGYKSITAIPFESLSSGYHIFTLTFDGEYARLFVDGVLSGISEKFISGFIGYNETNGLFIGADAGDDTTTPEIYNSGYDLFFGTVDYVYIENYVRHPTVVTSNTQNTVLGNHTLSAQWADYVSFDPNGGAVSTNSKIVKIGDSYGDLPVPTREGYTFGGWVNQGILPEEQSLIEQTVFTGKSLINKTTFTGSNFIALGKDYKYEDKITIIVRASMDNWSLFSSQNMTLFSCAQTGGWNLFSKNGYLYSDIYDKGIGYKPIFSSVSLAELSSGYHVFTETFDGEYARLYVDGVLSGTSAKFSSGKIGYNGTNGLFIGAEAGDDTTTPETWMAYFQGEIDYFSIENRAIAEEYIDGVQFLALGRTRMYEDKLSITVKASMDNWSLFSSRNMTLFSCAQSGGWNLFSVDGYLYSDIYDRDVGYKPIVSSVSLAELSSGYHTFTETFDGEYARLYIDGVLSGTSGRFSSGKIGYNDTNGIFVGAEAYNSTTTPDSTMPYFVGDVEYFYVENCIKKPTIITSTTQNITRGNHTLVARWIKNS